jgi:hypothetical protein
MPRITHDQKQFYESHIRRLISTDNGTSRRGLQKDLDKLGLHPDRNYVGSGDQEQQWTSVRTD